MIFAQFYQRSATGPDLIEACGDRSVVVLDGRGSKSWLGETAATECKRRGYAAWRLFKGETFTRSSPISQLWPISSASPVQNPAWLSAHGM